MRLNWKAHLKMTPVLYLEQILNFSIYACFSKNAVKQIGQDSASPFFLPPRTSPSGFLYCLLLLLPHHLIPGRKHMVVLVSHTAHCEH